MPKWKGKKVSRKRYYDLVMYKELRELLKEKQTVYVSKPRYEELRAFIKMQEGN